MGKWALFAAHRSVQAGAAVPRTVGPDGRCLQRGWRQRSEQAVRSARRIRATRPQSIWPKVLGWVCIGVACVGTLMPVTPLPRHVPVSAAGGPVPEPAARSLQIPALERAPDGSSFAWDAGAIEGPFSIVLLAADYTPLARADGIEASPWRPSNELAEHLLPGQTYHAYVLGGEQHDTVRSPLLTFAHD